jgi:hypothetical protein
MATIKQFEDIECWQLARQLFSDIHHITLLGDFNKDFALKDQIRSRRFAIGAKSKHVLKM